MKPPAKRLPLAVVVALCAVGVVACGKSSPSSSTSASVATTSKTASGDTSTGSTTGSTTGSATGSATGSTGSGSGGSTQPGATRRRVKKVGTGTGSSSTPRRRVKSSNLRLCLEKNGIKPHSPGSKAATRVQLQAALARCDRSLAPQLNSRRTYQLRRQLLAKPAYRRALARFTSCMRSHGVPGFPEANTSGNGPLYPSSAVKSSPQVRAAQRACIGQLRVH
jgi:hypothetical protein